MIRFREVSVKKDGQAILTEIDLSLSERRIGIIGRNGSGKSTFARLFNGLETPTNGSVTLNGQGGSKALRRHVGFVFQNPDNQIVYPIVHEDLEFGLKNLGLGKDEMRARIDTVLRRFQLEHLRDRLTHQLSGGEKQMIALAGVLVMRPRLIVLDEPTTLLDLWNKRRFMAAIHELEQQIVLVSHDLDLLDGFDRVLHIDGGQVVADGLPDPVIAGYTAGAQC
ncbi:energy-coupling factor ABC transporter ATP-binding protein [Pontibaca salina]|uniref:ABC transporter ATP-binding protein n=1 Tax=Pontibaca salina TaxID=2795731 RepID=A0A934HHZ1_9RHOB|nr:ABC transporter ATP-binding protein [Pontibaca salina]MBI6628504.1 ABC transporter ATP-binding protein [Pontibaca salina]